MQENFAVWMTPKSIGRLSQYIQSRELIEEIAKAYDEYLSVACKPLLSTPSAMRDRLPEFAARFAVQGNEARLKLVFAIQKGLGNDPQRLLDFSWVIQKAVPEVRSLAAHLFEAQYLECFEMGARVYVRSIQTLTRALQPGGTKIAIHRDLVEKFYEWLHVAGCLDLSASTILWYLSEDRSPERAPIAEELCFLLKEYALAYGSLIHILFAQPQAREARDVGASLRDLRWDTDFCALTLPDLGKHLAAS